jgi:ABC-type dipeptide/oligopeptide/nickel transport system ATPase component
MNKMNIVEAYIEHHKQCVILMSGFSGSGKSLIAKSLMKDINKSKSEKSKDFTFINLNDFLKSESEYNVTVDVSGIKIVDWDSPDAVDWVKFNEEVDKNKKTGVIISGFAFPKDKLNFTVDFHIHFKISKDELIKNRHEFTQEKLDDKTSRIGEIGEEMEKKILNKITFPHYLKSLENSVITKFFVVNYGEIKKTYDDTFDYMMAMIKKKLN